MSVWYQRPDGRWLVYCRKRKAVYLWSRIVIWNARGRELRRDEHVHHVNGDCADDRIENLAILSPSEHSRLHGRSPERLAVLEKALPKARAIKLANAAAITHCPHGHPYSGDNLKIEGGKRVCLECKRARHRAWLRRQRELAA